jgi:hypothetical protein
VIRAEEAITLQLAPSSQPRPNGTVVMVARTDALRIESGFTTVRPYIGYDRTVGAVGRR